MHRESSRGRSPRRSVSPRSEPGYRRSPRSPMTESSLGDRNGHRPASRSRSRSRSRALSGARTRSRTRSRSRSWTRSPAPRSYRGRSYSRSLSPPNYSSRSSKIVVEKLTKNVTESHLFEIFGNFGDIQSLDLPMNNAFMTNRGTAYILYYDPADAEAAISHMHEAQLDGAVLNVSIVLPKRAFSRSPPPPSSTRDDYGHRRAQHSPYVHRSSPPRRYGRPRRMERHDLYRPRSISRSRSRSRSPRRSRSFTSLSPSASPPRRRARVHDDSPRRGRRRSPSYSSYGYSSRSRSRSHSHDRGRNRRGPSRR